MDLASPRANARREADYNPLGLIALALFGVVALWTKLLACGLWGALALLGFDPFEEE